MPGSSVRNAGAKDWLGFGGSWNQIPQPEAQFAFKVQLLSRACLAPNLTEIFLSSAWKGLLRCSFAAQPSPPS